MKLSPLDAAIERLDAARQASYALEAAIKELCKKDSSIPTELWNKPNSSGFSCSKQETELKILKMAKKA